MLGLKAPWKLTEVNTDHGARKVVLRMHCEDTAWGDPDTGQRLHLHSWEPERSGDSRRQKRTWRHLDFWQYETVLAAEVPRVQEPESGQTRMVQVPSEAASHSAVGSGRYS